MREVSDMGKVGAAARVARVLAVVVLILSTLAAPTRLAWAADEDQQELSAEQVQQLASQKGDGTYYGSAQGYQSTITVAVTVQSGRIASVKIVSQADDETYVRHAEKVIPRVIDKQATQVDTSAGATFSSEGILHAVNDALTGSGSLSLTASPVFGYAMVGVALALLVVSGVLAARWRGLKGARARGAALRWQRRAIQLAFFIVAPSTFASAFMGIKTVFMEVQVMNTHRGYSYSFTAFMALLIALVAFGVVFGRYFCGYACSFGFFNDLVSDASRWVQRKTGHRLPPMPLAAERVLRFLKYAVLIAICVVILMGFMQFVSENSPWTAYSSILAMQLKRITPLGAVLLGLTVVGMVWKPRFFCEFLCPLGAVFSVVPTLPTGHMRRKRRLCHKGCAACRHTCPVGVEPAYKVIAGECISCGECAEVCPAHNVVLGLEPRADAKPSASLRLRALLLSRPVTAVAKAVLLVALLWLMNSVRFLPMAS